MVENEELNCSDDLLKDPRSDRNEHAVDPEADGAVRRGVDEFGEVDEAGIVVVVGSI